MDNKTIVITNATSGGGTFSDDIVGFQLVEGGGLTQGNFRFTTTLTEKSNRKFSVGAFSKPITLDTLEITNLLESKAIFAKEFRVYPNFDLSEITKFSLYGSLTKRISASVEKIINFFPAALEVYELNADFTKSPTVVSSSYDLNENVTTFLIDVTKISNPFEIDYSINATRNLSVKENIVSELRNFTTQYSFYSLYVDNIEYPVLFASPSLSLYTGLLKMSVEGNPFSGASTSNSTLVIRPNTYYTEKAFTEPFDEVEEFLLNRLITPKYTARFQVPKESPDGIRYIDYVSLTWPLSGVWNLDIYSLAFTDYLRALNEVAIAFDESTTNLIVRFLTTDAIKEFDTEDQRAQKILNIFGRSFDDVKKYVDGLSHMVSVNYTVKNDIPSQLLRNLAETVGWKINISPIQNLDFLDAVYGTGGENLFSGYQRPQTPNELNYQFYRNLILNGAYLFKSKGTRKSIEFLLKLVGVPDALLEFNEHVYIANSKLSVSQFYNSYSNISGGTSVSQIPTTQNSTFSIKGVSYPTLGSTTSISNVTTTLIDYPIDVNGYPKSPIETNDFFFQKGAGWFELVKDHQSPLVVSYANSTFDADNFNVQTEFEKFTYGEKYLDRYRSFPYLGMGFSITRTPDNRKSWTYLDVGDRRGNGDAKYDAQYHVSDERLVLNVKNVDLFLNPAQGLLYDIWYMSNQYGYPIPCSGLTNPTFNPDPCNKSFFEFKQTFVSKTISVRDRLYSNKSYCLLQTIYDRYINSLQIAGIPNNNFTYDRMLEYVNGLGDFWIRLVEQMIPATTIWVGGTKIENSLFDRQRYNYRINRGCCPLRLPCTPCTNSGQIFDSDCINEEVKCPIYPWVEVGSTVQSFKDVLSSTITNYITTNQLTCDLNSLITNWYIELSIDNNVVFKQIFYTGYGFSDAPSDSYYRFQLDSYLPSLSDQYLTYFLKGDYLYVSNAGCDPLFTNKQFKLNVGLDFKLSCD